MRKIHTLSVLILVAALYSILIMKEARKEAQKMKDADKAVYRILYYFLIPLSAVVLFILANRLSTQTIIGLTLLIFILNMLFLTYAYEKKA